MMTWVRAKFMDDVLFLRISLAAFAFSIAVIVFRLLWTGELTQVNTTLFMNSTSLLFASTAILSGLFMMRMLFEINRTKQLVKTDDLTGLINRREFNRILKIELETVKAKKHLSALLALDLDRFKLINDTYGHEAGDFVIREFGKRIKNVMREQDVVCRISGDEFFVMVSNIKDTSLVESISNRILHAMKEPFKFKGRSISTNVSIGSTVINQDLTSASEAMAEADFALLRSKEQGRDRHVQFDPVMAESIKKQRITEMELREAIAMQKLSIKYHPIVSKKDKDITAVEALVRWEEKAGKISTSEFLHLASELNLIKEIDAFVLERACLEIGRIPDLRLAINVDEKQFIQDDFIQNIFDTLDRTGFDPKRLELEIPQTLLSLRLDGITDKFERLRSAGILIALGDFGTGYSNMMFLQDFKLDRIKLDHSFVQQMSSVKEGEAMVGNMIALGKTFCNQVTVEGIETQTQLQFLKEKNCDEFQGFLFSQPLTCEELVANLSVRQLNASAEKLQSVKTAGTKIQCTA